MTSQRRAWLLFALTVALALAGGVAAAIAVRLPAANEFNVAGWELRHAPDKWLYLSGRFFDGGQSPAEEDERVGSFVFLTSQIEQLQADPEANAAELTRLRHERKRIENDVEAILEGRLTAVLEDAGLTSSFPLFPSARWVFPPVDVRFDDPPRVIAISPRARIELIDTIPLRPGLSREDAIGAERAAERNGRRSALAFNVEGVASYPSIVAPVGDYELLVQTFAHEWVHHYLAFKPLGLRYARNAQLRTLNETVADVAGQELGSLLVERYPLPPAIDAQLAARAPSTPAVGVDAVLRRVRLDVDALLKAGKIDVAEALMEQRRQELAKQGVVFRRINQAFFAFQNIYADTASAVDPIGGEVDRLRRREGSVGAFLKAAAQLTSAAGLRKRLAGGN